jgi:hypothetical protein
MSEPSVSTSVIVWPSRDGILVAGVWSRAQVGEVIGVVTCRSSLHSRLVVSKRPARFYSPRQLAVHVKREANCVIPVPA